MDKSGTQQQGGTQTRVGMGAPVNTGVNPGATKVTQQLGGLGAQQSLQQGMTGGVKVGYVACMHTSYA
jgi:hypothetical protein